MEVELFGGSHSEIQENKKHRNERRIFTEDEDTKLSSLVSVFGINKWPYIARLMDNRTARQCRERYNNYLSPQISNAVWTNEEDLLLIELYKEYGTCWAKMVKHFNRRSGNNIKNRWNTYLKNEYMKENNIDSLFNSVPVFSDNSGEQKMMSFDQQCDYNMWFFIE